MLAEWKFSIFELGESLPLDGNFRYRREDFASGLIATARMESLHPLLPGAEIHRLLKTDAKLKPTTVVVVAPHSNKGRDQ